MAGVIYNRRGLNILSPNITVRLNPEQSIYIRWTGEHFDIMLKDILSIIWDVKRYRYAITTKASRYITQNRDAFSLGTQFIKLTSCKEYFTRYCHRDQLAKDQLERFNFEGFESRIEELYLNHVIDARDNSIREHKRVLREWDDLHAVFNIEEL